MLGILRNPFERITQDVDSVARRKIELELVRVLQKFDRQIEHLRVREWKVVAENGQLVFPAGMPQGKRRLQAALDVVGNLERRFVFVHGDGAAEITVGWD